MAGNPLISSFWHFDPPKAWPRLPGFLVNFECVQFVHPTLCHLFLEVEVRLPIHIQKTSWISWAIVEQTNERVAATFGQWRMLTGLCEVDPTVVWWGLTHNTVHTWRRLRTLILSPLEKAWIASIGNQNTPAGWPMARTAPGMGKELKLFQFANVQNSPLDAHFVSIPDKRTSRCCWWALLWYLELCP